MRALAEVLTGTVHGGIGEFRIVALAQAEVSEGVHELIVQALPAQGASVLLWTPDAEIDCPLAWP